MDLPPMTSIWVDEDQDKLYNGDDDVVYLNSDKPLANRSHIQLPPLKASFVPLNKKQSFLASLKEKVTPRKPAGVTISAPFAFNHISHKDSGSHSKSSSISSAGSARTMTTVSTIHSLQSLENEVLQKQKLAAQSYAAKHNSYCDIADQWSRDFRTSLLVETMIATPSTLQEPYCGVLSCYGSSENLPANDDSRLY